MTEHGHQLADDAIVCIKGRLDTRDETPKLVAMEVKRPDLVLDGGPPVRLRLTAGALSETRIGELRDLLAAHPGDSPVYVHLDAGPRTTVLRLGDNYLVDARNGLFGELRVLFGSAAVL
jgi:DNA polymerase III subunit alpha